jgi:hypothetical protein
MHNKYTGQNPIVLHVAGDWRSPIFSCIQKEARRSIPSIARPEPCEDVTVVTWNNHAKQFEKPLGAFEESCGWWGVEPVVLGEDIPHPWSNRKHKITTLIDALKNDIRTPFVLASDSGDSLLMGSPAELLRRYRKHFTADLVFLAGGPDSWPPVEAFIAFEESLPWARTAGGMTGLCPGTFIGRRRFVRELFEYAYMQPVVEKYSHSEQATIKQVWPKFYPRATLDYMAVLFQYWTGSHMLRFEHVITYGHDITDDIPRDGHRGALR